MCEIQAYQYGNKNNLNYNVKPKSSQSYSQTVYKSGSNNQVEDWQTSIFKFNRLYLISEMQVSKEKFCKCGHNKLDHKKKPESKFSIAGECKLCKCSEYLNRKLPGKFGFGTMIMGFSFIGMVILNIIMFFYPFLSIDKTFEMSIKSLATIGICMMLLICMYVFNSLILPYFQEKRRREYPIE